MQYAGNQTLSWDSFLLSATTVSNYPIKAVPTPLQGLKQLDLLLFSSFLFPKHLKLISKQKLLEPPKKLCLYVNRN